MKTKCTGYVVGSPYSRRGAGRYDECEAPAKYLVVQDYTATGGNAYRSTVCGIHVRRFRSMVARNNRVAVTLDDPTIAERVTVHTL